MREHNIRLFGAISQTKILLLLISLILSFLAYWGGLADLVTRWNKQEEYSHGYFIPLIALWFLWHRKDALEKSIGQPEWKGVFFVLIGMCGLILGEVTAIFILIQLGFILTLIGAVLAFGGRSLLKVSVLPILFLIFAIPLPYFIDAQLSWRLQIISSQLGVSILRALGDSVFLEGNVIDLGSYKLQVVEACSGLRYLYPLLSIGFLVAYMYKAVFWKKVVLFLSTIPITVLMNSFRIAVVGILVNKWGSSQAEGFAHYFEGWVIFMVCLFLLVSEVLIMEKFGLKRGFNQAVDLPEIKKVNASIGAASNLPLILIILLLLISIGVVNIASKREEITPKKDALIAFPSSLRGWKANVSHLDKDVLKTLQVDDYFIADYSNQRNENVNFYVAYYASQRKGVSPHSPQVCMPGGGWIISKLDKMTLDIKGRKDFHVNRTVINKDNTTQIVYYWFEQRGRHIANEYMVKWYLLIDSIKKNRSDGALVRVTTYVNPNEPIENADKRIVNFLEESVPALEKFVPN